MERRSSLRRPIHHDAMLRLDDGASWPCIIADYCSEGMLLKYEVEVCDALSLYLKGRANRNFTVAFLGQQGEQYALKSMPTHVIEHAAGVRFIGRYDDAIQSLVEFNLKQRHQKVPEGEVKLIVRQCIDCILGYTQSLMNEFYPVVIQEVKDAAVAASSDQQANSIMESANTITRDQNKMLQVFMAAIQDPKAVLEKNDLPNTDDLSLIDKGEFEDWLTSRVLITKAETNYRAQLLPLKMRLDAIGIGDKRYHQSPLGPALLVNAFHSSLNRLEATGQVERLIFKIFEKQVVVHLEPLYKDLNDILIQHKVLPDLDINKISPKKSTTPLPNKEKTGEKTKVDEEEQTKNIDEGRRDEPIFSYGTQDSSYQGSESSLISAESQSIVSSLPPFSSPNGAETGFKQNHQDAETAFKNVLGLVRSLRMNQNAVAAEQGITAPTEVYSESELSQTLSELQTSSVETEQLPEDRSSLMKRVQFSLDASSPQEEGGDDKGIHESQQVAIDVVDRFFASMQKNPRLSQEAKQHLLKLEVPVLKVLLKDERFFDDRNSSVHAVMNRIAQLGASGTRMSPSIRKKVDSLVKTVVQEFEHDTEVFDRVLKEMDTLVERQNKLYVKNVERVAAAAEGIHKVEQAKIEVAKALNHRLKQHAVPPAVLTLIENGWQDLLQLIHLKHGENSSEWRDALSVIDALISFGNDPSSPLDMKLILPKIQAGLKLASGNDEPSIVIRDALKILMKSGPIGAQECVQVKLRDIPETDDDIVLRNTKISQELKHWILRAKSFQPGAWVQFTRDDSDMYYMRLVWVAKGYSKFVFVNHQGMKVVELGLFKLASYLKNKQVVPDSNYEVPIVNQGLDDMVKDVYEKLAYDSSHDIDTGLANKREFCRQVKAVMKAGSRTSACHLLYVNFKLTIDPESTVLPATLSKSIANILLDAKEKTSVVGRVGASAFVLFRVISEPEEQVYDFNDKLTTLCQDASGLVYAQSESRAHLGFNNPELMIDHAVKSMSDMASADPQQTTEPEESDLLSESEIAELDQMNADCIQNASGNEITSSDLLDAVSDLPVNLELYVQKITPVSEKAVYGEQHDLVCSVVDSGVSYEPESEDDICQLDRWWVQQLILRKECHEPAWDEIQIAHIKLSAYSFKDDTFKDWLLELVENGRLDAEQIWFDLYDCSEIENIHAAADMMKHLMAKGFHFCLDHFGTSRSPFALLKALPVDMIKIDESFMLSMNDDDADESAADSISEVAHYLGKEVIACSVDTAICFQRMKQLDIDYVQGTTVSEYCNLDVVIAPLVGG